MNNAVGAAPVESMLRLGIPVCLGNDGMGNAMWAEWKEAYFMHKQAHRDPRRMNGMDVAQMAIDNNRALAGVFWPDLPLGRLACLLYTSVLRLVRRAQAQHRPRRGQLLRRRRCPWGGVLLQPLPRLGQ